MREHVIRISSDDIDMEYARMVWEEYNEVVKSFMLKYDLTHMDIMNLMRFSEGV